MNELRYLLADRILVEGEIRSDLAVGIDKDGTIASVGPAPAGAEVERLHRRLLIPGLVNGHSHAFQRAIRGRSEYRQRGKNNDDFWTWREQMYAAASRLDPDQVEAISRMAFMEMALAGITSVGEFHYLHHPTGGGRYLERNELAQRVVAAAESVGVDPVLLRVAYARAGHDRQVDPRQLRFIDASAEETLASVEDLAARGVRVGLAPHSVRAVPLHWLEELGAFAKEKELPFHMHLSEQPREVEESVVEYGLRPAELLLREGLVDERFTGVHGVHLVDEEIEALGKAGATICACPTTERNLGDGVVRAKELYDAGVWISLGTDSQIEIALLQDARSLEYHLRLQRLERAILGSAEGDTSPDRLAARLFHSATVAGARSLGLPTGSIEAGLQADLVAVDLDDPSIAGSTGATLLPTLVFSMERTAVREVWSKGKQIVAAGRHPDQDEIVRDFQQAMAALWR